MKILFLAPQTPYPKCKASPARAYHLLAELAKKHGVALAYWVGDPREVRHVNSLRALCKGGAVTPVYLNRALAGLRGMQSLLQGRSYSEGYFGDVSFRAEIERLERKEPFDLIFAFTPLMAQFVLDRFNVPVVVNFVDVSSRWHEQAVPLQRSLPSALFGLERRRLQRFDRTIARYAQASIFASQAAADLFRGIAGKGATHVIPNGVGLELRRLPIGENHRDGNRAPKLTFIGALDNYANQDALRYFVNEVLPRVKQQCPETSLRIVGRAPAKVSRWFAGVRGITVAGNSSDVRACLVQGDVSVVPQRAGGVCQNRILEALAIGVPVVVSSEAIKALPQIFEKEVLVGDRPAAFAAHILRLVNDRDLYRSVATNGRKFAAQHFSWKAAGAKLAGVMENLVPPAHERSKYFEAKHGAR